MTKSKCTKNNIITYKLLREGKLFQFCNPLMFVYFMQWMAVVVYDK